MMLIEFLLTFEQTWALLSNYSYNFLFPFNLVVL